MFAIGFVLIVLAMVIVRLMGNKRNSLLNAADTVGVLLAIAGMTLITISTVILMWKYLP
jgi:hypothetical protein